MQMKKPPIFELFTKQNIEFKFVLFLIDQTLDLPYLKGKNSGHQLAIFASMNWND